MSADPDDAITPAEVIVAPADDSSAAPVKPNTYDDNPVVSGIISGGSDSDRPDLGVSVGPLIFDADN